VGGVDRKRAAIKTVPRRVIINPIPPGLPDSPGGKPKDPAIRRDRERAVLRQRAGSGWRV